MVLRQKEYGMKTDKIFVMHEKIDGIYSGAIIGSYCKNRYMKKFSDIDLFFIVEDDYAIQSALSILREDYSVEKSYDVYSITVDEVAINISYHYLRDMEKLISKIISCDEIYSTNRPWTLGGVCDDVLMDDFQNAIIYFDKNKFLNDTKDRINESLVNNWQTKMEQKLEDDYDEKKRIIEKYYKRKEYKLAYVGLIELGQIEDRLMFARQKKIYPGFKYMYRMNNSNRGIFELIDENMCKNILTSFFEEDGK